MNRWNIPKELEEKIEKRDRSCVYCNVGFNTNSNTDKATWEHIANDAQNISESNIARCCFSCNASKGRKGIYDWLESDYCKKKGIDRRNVANVVKEYLDSHTK